MYRYTILAVGKMKNRALSSLCADYTKRLRRQGSCEMVELKDGSVESEGQRIVEAIEKRSGSMVYALAEEGKERSSSAFAKELYQLQGRPALFVIGGAFGLSPAVKTLADNSLSLSQMTLTHEMARLLLIEQIYRSVAINTGSKYHHD